MTVMTATARTVGHWQDSERSKTCFVIGPIGDRHAALQSAELKAYEDSLQVFEKVVLPGCAKFGIVPVRSDRIASVGGVADRVWQKVMEADVVIADLSGGNPNVMYELMFCHIAGKPTIHIAEHGRLPSGVAEIRTIQFSRSPSGLVDARNELQSAMEEALNNDFEPLAPARILRGMKMLDGVRKAADPEGDTVGLIERFVRVEEQMESMTETVDAIGEGLTTIATLTEEATPEMERASQPGSPMAARVPVMAKYAASIKEPSAALKERATQFTGQMAEMDAAVQAALDLIRQIPPDERGDDWRGFLDQLVGTSEGAKGIAEGLDMFEKMLKLMLGMSRELRGPGKDLTSAMKQVRTVVARLEVWEAQAHALL